MRTEMETHTLPTTHSFLTHSTTLVVRDGALRGLHSQVTLLRRLFRQQESFGSSGGAASTAQQAEDPQASQSRKLALQSCPVCLQTNSATHRAPEPKGRGSMLGSGWEYVGGGRGWRRAIPSDLLSTENKTLEPHRPSCRSGQVPDSL